MRRCNTEIDFDIKEFQISPDDIYNQYESQNIIPLLICQICFQVLNSPVQCQKCDNCFCELCIQKNKKCCPYRCYNPNFKKNKFVNNVLATLKFKCKNGCKKIISYDELEKHYDEDCDNVDYKAKFKKLNRIYKDVKKKETNY